MTHLKHASADHEILDVIRRRWSPRAFDDSRRVAHADLLRLLEAARWAPSSMNAQPWGFVITDRQETPEAFVALVDTLTGRNPSWAAAAPMLVLVAVRGTAGGTSEPNRHAWYDAGHAVALFVMQATAIGLSVRQMEGFDRDRAGTALGVPGGFEPAVIMAIGYAGDPETLEHEKHRLAERQTRTRQPLGTFAFSGRWGASIDGPGSGSPNGGPTGAGA